MIYFGKYQVSGVNITACDYEYILNTIKTCIQNNKKLLISPLASQTLVKAYFDKKLKKILNQYDELYPDSQWVKRALYFLYGIKLKERVYGPELMMRTCRLASAKKYRIFLYGTTKKTLYLLRKRLLRKFPSLKIIGSIPSKFRNLTLKEKKELIGKIEKSQTDVLMISLGSPLEQEFAHELTYVSPKLTKPIVIIPFGAAFDFIAGVKPQAPKWMQDAGFEWLFRLLCEPRRLWKRYLIYGPLFVILVLLQKIKLLLDRETYKFLIVSSIYF